MATTTRRRSTSAQGILIGGPHSRNQWRIGRILGSGACGAVHDVEAPVSASRNKHGAQFVVKVAPLPPPRQGNKKKKKKKTDAERNADMLYYESTMYTAKLSHLRGSVIADVPLDVGGLSCYGEANGFAYLAMEKMEAPLEHVVSLLQQQQGRVVSLGSVARALIDIVEALHCQRMLAVDVKMDNFMLAAASSSGKQKEEGVAERIRMIDLGLLESYHDLSTGKHRGDAYPSATVCGTPSYASICVLQGHTVSRRDDLEAIGYILLELGLLAWAGAATGGGAPLPWAECASDEDVLRLKLQELDGGGGDGGSAFSKLGTRASTVLRQYFDRVRNLKYAAKPDYEGLKTLLQNFQVESLSSTSASSSTSTSTTLSSSSSTFASNKDASSSSSSSFCDVAAVVHGDNDDDDVTMVSAAATGSDDDDDDGDSPRRRRRRRMSGVKRRMEQEEQDEQLCWMRDDKNDNDKGVSLRQDLETKRPAKGRRRDDAGEAKRGVAAAAAADETMAREILLVDDDDDDDVEYDEDVPTERAKRCLQRAARRNLGGGRGQGGRRVAGSSSSLVEVQDNAAEEENKGKRKARDAPVDLTTLPGRRQEVENVPPPSSLSRETSSALTLRFTEGPHKGDEIRLGGDYSTSFIIGTAPHPRRRGGADTFQIHAANGGVAEQHVKVVLQSTTGGKLYSVDIYPLQGGMCWVNGKAIAVAKKKPKRAFVGDVLRLGNCCLLQIVKK